MIDTTMGKYNVTKNRDDEGNRINTYNTLIFDFDVSKQPYNKELAQKEYGLMDDGISHKCYFKNYDPDKELKQGDYVKDDEGCYIIIWLQKWDENIEFILKVDDYAG